MGDNDSVFWISATAIVLVLYIIVVATWVISDKADRGFINTMMKGFNAIFAVVGIIALPFIYDEYRDVLIDLGKV